MLLSVPYYSQHLDVVDPYWQSRACGVACLKMLLEATGTSTPSLDELILHGKELGAYGEHGWIHQGLLTLGAAYRAPLQRLEWRHSDTRTADQLNEEGIAYIIDELRAHRPVIISAIKKFVETDKFHMVILVGFEERERTITGFFYHDPDAYTLEDGMNQYVPMSIFRDAWRKMAIVREG